MNLVKKFILIFLFTFSFRGYSQELNGKYTWTEPSGLSTKIIIINGNQFQQCTFNELDSFKTSGHLLFSDHRLTLNYNQSKKINPSIYQIKETKNNSHFINIKVKDGENDLISFAGALMFINLKDGSKIQLSANHQGEVDFGLINRTSINSISILALGYDIINIPIDKIPKTGSIIECILKIASPPQIKKATFKIVKLKNGNIIMVDESNGLIYKKN